MLELNAITFVAAVTEVRRLITVLSRSDDLHSELVTVPVKHDLGSTIAMLMENLTWIGAQSAWVAADRLHKRLTDNANPISFGELNGELSDIERRFADHLQFIRLFVLWGEQLRLLSSPVELLGEPTASRFTSVWFDCEEAAKCICLQRPTAAVFHCMRMLEVGIKALAARLGIPDPVRPAQRNWGIILKTIKAKIDSSYPAAERLHGSEGALMEAIYATLDAVKNPWRNEVMHVEGVYTDAEARFILLNAVAFIQRVATGFDENGTPVEPELPVPQNQ